MSLRLSRRSALGAVGSALLAASTRPALAKRSTRPLGLADITLRKELAADYAGTLKRVAAMGYSHFGFRLADHAPNSTEPNAADKARLVRDAGMEIGPVRLNPVGNNPEQEIEIAAQIGATIIALTAAPVFVAGGNLGTATRADFDAWLPRLVELDAMCRKVGLTLAFHNHWWDHRKLDGESPWELIANSTEVAFELNCAWAWLGGVAPLDLARQYADRVVSMHFKDVDTARGPTMFQQLVAPGEGRLDYAALLPNLDRVTRAIGYVEVDAPAHGLAAAAGAARFLRDVRSKWRY